MTPLHSKNLEMPLEKLQTLMTNNLGNGTSSPVQSGNEHEISHLTGLWQSRCGNNGSLCPTLG